jgi:hypothetical protein
MDDPPTTKPRRGDRNLYVVEFKYVIMRFFIFAFSLFLFVFTITAQTDSINSLFDVAIEVDSGITDSIQTIQDNNIDKDSDKAKESSTSIGLTIFTLLLTFLTIVSSVRCHCVGIIMTFH